MRRVRVGTDVHRRRTPLSMARSNSRAVAPWAARSMMVRVTVVTRTPLRTAESSRDQSRVVRTAGPPFDRRCRGTTNSTASVLSKPSRPHHLAAARPANAARLPSHTDPARTRSSHVSRVAAWHHTLGISGRHSPDAILRAHCRDDSPAARSSRRPTRK